MAASCKFFCKITTAKQRLMLERLRFISSWQSRLLVKREGRTVLNTSHRDLEQIRVCRIREMDVDILQAQVSISLFCDMPLWIGCNVTENTKRNIGAVRSAIHLLEGRSKFGYDAEYGPTLFGFRFNLLKFSWKNSDVCLKLLLSPWKSGKYRLRGE